MKEYKMQSPPKEYDGLHTSKGNQLKWQQDGYWYKADQFGYEGIAETVVSSFLRMIKVPFPYVSYEQALIQYKEKKYSGCRSRDFFEEYPDLRGDEIVPLERLHRVYTGLGLAKQLGRMAKVEDRISYTVDFVRDITGLDDFADYLSFMIQVDAFFLNEDRHMNNISVMWDPETDTYAYCPYYDFGLSLFSDTREDFPLDMDFAQCRSVISAKPFSLDFDEQLDICEKIGSSELHFPFSKMQMRRETERVLGDMDMDPRIGKRMTETLAYQANKYQYMFLR